MAAQTVFRKSLDRASRRDAEADTEVGVVEGDFSRLNTVVGTSPGGATAEESLAVLRVVPDDERYAHGEVIGRGGMGEVRSAIDRRVGREVAIKKLAVADGAPPHVVNLFVREARIQGLLDHPAIVPVHDLGVDDEGRPYFVMKRLGGVTLAEVLDGHAEGDDAMMARFPRRALLQRFADVCQAVEFAHSRGVTHRDLKPSNIMLGEFGEAWVLDWGCARLDADDDRVAPRDIDGRPVTQTDNLVVGTPGFMAPEQIAAGEPCDHRVDVYALGCVLFEILAGSPLHPVGREAVRSTVIGVDARPSARNKHGDVPPELDAVCVRATAREAADRYARVRDLLDDLQRYLDGDRDLAGRRALARRYASAAAGARDRGDRTEAMRQAGRALALDPGNSAAATIVGQLMLEPPAEAPPEVAFALEDADAEVSRRHGRSVLSLFAIYAMVLPLLVWQGVTAWPVFAMIAALMGFHTWLSINNMRMRGLPSLALMTCSAVGNAALIALLSRYAGPFVVLPGAVATTTMGLMTHPVLVNRPFRVGGIMMAGFLAPFGFEAVGLARPLWHLENGRLIAESGLVNLGSTATLSVLIGMTLLTIGLTTYATRALAVLRRDAQHQVELQAWHLRQLVPEEATGQHRASTLRD